MYKKRHLSAILLFSAIVPNAMATDVENIHPNIVGQNSDVVKREWNKVTPKKSHRNLSIHRGENKVPVVVPTSPIKQGNNQWGQKSVVPNEPTIPESQKSPINKGLSEKPHKTRNMKLLSPSKRIRPNPYQSKANNNKVSDFYDSDEETTETVQYNDLHKSKYNALYKSNSWENLDDDDLETSEQDNLLQQHATLIVLKQDEINSDNVERLATQEVDIPNTSLSVSVEKSPPIPRYEEPKASLIISEDDAKWLIEFIDKLEDQKQWVRECQDKQDEIVPTRMTLSNERISPKTLSNSNSNSDSDWEHSIDSIKHSIDLLYSVYEESRNEVLSDAWIKGYSKLLSDVKGLPDDESKIIWGEEGSKMNILFELYNTRKYTTESLESESDSDLEEEAIRATNSNKTPKAISTTFTPPQISYLLLYGRGLPRTHCYGGAK